MAEMPPAIAVPRAGFPVDLGGRGGGGSVLGGVEGDEAVAAVVEAEGDELLREVGFSR